MDKFSSYIADTMGKSGKENNKQQNKDNYTVSSARIYPTEFKR